MDLKKMGVQPENYSTWSYLRRAFNVSVANGTDYVEDQYKPEFAAPVIEYMAEFVRSHNGPDLPEEEIDDFSRNIPNEEVRELVSLQLKGARKRVLNRKP